MSILSDISHYNGVINNIIWNKTGILILLLIGIWSSLVLKFFQFSHFNLWCTSTLKNTFKIKRKNCMQDKSAITPFQSMCTSLAATIGVGNIVGVSSAIYTGGPGAVFWMWVAAIFGMMTGYSENVLGTYFRRKNFSGEWCGGPMYYLEDGLGSKPGMKKIGKMLAVSFAFSTVLASFGIGSMGQINKIVINLESAFPVPFLANKKLYDGVSFYSLFIGTGLFLIAAFVIIGGIKRLARVTEKLVPFMVVFFLLGSFAVILKNYKNILPALESIFSSAFNFEAGFGGMLGTAFSQGLKRGVFSNEAGMGSSAIIHANSSIKEPAEQGMLSMFEIFVDTIVICTVTALVVLTSGVYNSADAVSESTMVARSFDSVFAFGGLGQRFVAISIFLFSFSSVLGWNHYGAKAWEYMFGTSSVFLYKTLHLISIIAGALLTSSLAWDISDTFNGFMMIPNLIGIILLFDVVKNVTDNYLQRKIAGKNITPVTSYLYQKKKNVKN